jgi:hypothetical protein
LRSHIVVGKEIYTAEIVSICQQNQFNADISVALVDIERDLTYFVNCPDVSKLLGQSTNVRRQPDAICSFRDGTHHKRLVARDGAAQHLDIALYADENEPLNPLGMRFCFILCMKHVTDLKATFEWTRKKHVIYVYGIISCRFDFTTRD